MIVCEHPMRPGEIVSGSFWTNQINSCHSLWRWDLKKKKIRKEKKAILDNVIMFPFSFTST